MKTWLINVKGTYLWDKTWLPKDKIVYLWEKNLFDKDEANHRQEKTRLHKDNGLYLQEFTEKEGHVTLLICLIFLTCLNSLISISVNQVLQEDSHPHFSSLQAVQMQMWHPPSYLQILSTQIYSCGAPCYWRPLEVPVSCAQIWLYHSQCC